MKRTRKTETIIFRTTPEVKLKVLQTAIKRKKTPSKIIRESLSRGVLKKSIRQELIDYEVYRHNCIYQGVEKPNMISVEIVVDIYLKNHSNK